MLAIRDDLGNLLALVPLEVKQQIAPLIMAGTAYMGVRHVALAEVEMGENPYA